MNELNFKDKFEKNIILTLERIKHISLHIQVNNYISIIENTLKYPEILSKDSEKNIYYYQKYLKLENIYFIIVVKLTNEEGSIITVYKMQNQKNETKN